jgi:hypothetical protein
VTVLTVDGVRVKIEQMHADEKNTQSIKRRLKSRMRDIV